MINNHEKIQPVQVQSSYSFSFLGPNQTWSPWSSWLLPPIWSPKISSWAAWSPDFETVFRLTPSNPGAILESFKGWQCSLFSYLTFDQCSERCSIKFALSFSFYQICPCHFNFIKSALVIIILSKLFYEGINW